MSATTRRHRILGPLVGMVILGLTAGVAAASGASHASARIVAVDPGDATKLVTIGWAKFTEDATDLLHVNVKVSGLTPGLHGIHIHAAGVCDGPAFTSALTHHNPGNALHGLNPDRPGAHAGDLPNLIVNVAGQGHLNVKTDRARLSIGQLAVLDGNGSAIIIHRDLDDQNATSTTGNSGPRVACGVIVAD